MKLHLGFGILAAFVLGASPLFAATVYDASLASPTSSADPGWYDGSGNPNGGFTVVNNGGIELGLRAKYRQNPAVIDSPTSTYNVVTGAETAVTSGGPSAANRAAWNYEFSIDLQPSGVGLLTLADISAALTITDIGGNTVTINPLTYWGDDSGWGSAGKTTPESAGQWGVQQSENPNFGDFPLASFYDMNANNTYTFQLDVFRGANQNADSLLASDNMTVVVGTGSPTPLPASVWSGISMLVGLGAYGAFRKCRHAVVA